MKGDFSRITFDPADRFTRVLLQQGRVQLDADFNEQTDIFWHHLRALVVDLAGPWFGPGPRPGFEIQGGTYGFEVGGGLYFVEGVRCETEPFTWEWPEQPPEVRQAVQGDSFLVYLEASERHVSWAEAPAIREVALGGADTSSRARLVWAVRVRALSDFGTLPAPFKWKDITPERLRELLRRDEGEARAVPELRALARRPEEGEYSDPACPEARYRGLENQLYRVEIHRSGTAKAGAGALPGGQKGRAERQRPATFKWSRENGSVIFALRAPMNGKVAQLVDLGRDPHLSLEVDDWVELTDDSPAAMRAADSLFQVEKVNRGAMEVTLSGSHPSIGSDLELHPLLRRWDQEEPSGRRVTGQPVFDGGAACVEEGRWLDLEDGVQIRFEPMAREVSKSAPPPAPRAYRRGDYWLIPARTATGDVAWESEVEGEEHRPKARKPDGVHRVVAPLALIDVANTGKVTVQSDLRRVLKPASEPVK